MSDHPNRSSFKHPNPLGNGRDQCAPASESAPSDMRTLAFRPLFKLEAEVAPSIDFGATSSSPRRLVPVTGGWFHGDRLRGKLLAGGSDVQRLRLDSAAELCIHAAMETEDGDRILLKGNGLRHAPPAVAEQLSRGENPDPNLYYFREAITFETASRTLRG